MLDCELSLILVIACGAGEILALPSRRVSSKFRARACISPAPQAIAKTRDYSQSISMSEKDSRPVSTERHAVGVSGDGRLCKLKD